MLKTAAPGHSDSVSLTHREGSKNVWRASDEVAGSRVPKIDFNFYLTGLGCPVLGRSENGVCRGYILSTPWIVFLRLK